MTATTKRKAKMTATAKHKAHMTDDEQMEVMLHP